VKCAKPGCKAAANPGRTYCGKHRGVVWGGNYQITPSTKTKPTRRAK
jgi:hypothetical protein